MPLRKVLKTSRSIFKLKEQQHKGGKQKSLLSPNGPIGSKIMH